jgi:lysophospholipase L1-like esterase
MPTLTTPSTVTFSLQVDQILTLTTNFGGGRVVLSAQRGGDVVFDYTGDQFQNAPVFSSGSQGLVTITHLAGSLTYNVNTSAFGLDSPEVVSTRALVSAAGNFGQTTFVALGDSITAGAEAGGRGDNSFVTWALGLTLGRAVLLNNAGVSGNTVAQMYARIQSDVLAYSPKCVTVMGGINSINAGLSAALVWDDPVNGGLKQIYDTLRANSIRVIACSILPLASGHPSFSAANTEKALWVNQKIKDYCYANQGTIFFDAFAVVVDPTSLTAAAATSMIDSGNIHPSAFGARKMGAKLAAVLNNILPAWDNLPSSYADSYLVTAGNTNRAPNPTFVGTSGTLIGVASGSVANNWNAGNTTGSPACVCSVVTRSDGIGRNQRCVVTSAANNDAVTIRTGNLASNVAVGDTVYFECSVSLVSVTALQALRTFIQYKVDGGAYIYVFGMANSTTTCDTTDLAEIVLRTPNLTFAGATINEVYFGVQVIHTGVGGSTLEVGRAHARRVT